MSQYIARGPDSPAFPYGFDAHGQGISLRDYMACRALVGILSAQTRYTSEYKPDWFADEAYKLADAMLKRRTKTD